MKAFKTISVILLSACFLMACSNAESTEPNTNQNMATQPANANSTAPTGNATTPTAPNTNVSPNANRDVDAASTPSPANGKKEPDKTPAEAKPAARADAVAIFNAQRCATCHGADGKGKMKGAPDWTDPAVQKKLTDAAIIKGIKEGKNLMPPYESILTAEEIKALAAYVRSFAK